MSLLNSLFFKRNDMRELFAELLQYLEDNFIEYKVLEDEDEFLIDINNKVYQLFEPFKWDKNERGVYFDEHFNWACDRTEYDYYIFCFGSVVSHLTQNQQVRYLKGFFQL